MVTIMLIAFGLIAIISGLLLFAYCEPTRKKIEAQLEEPCDFFETKNINIMQGSFYGYNPLKKAIQIPEKENHALHDFFALQHELGHMEDDKNNVVFGWLKVIGFYRLIVLPGSFIIAIVNVITEAIPEVAIYVNIIILLAFVIFKLVYIFLYENSANRHAFQVCENFFDDEKMQITRRFARYNVMQQYLVTIAFAGLALVWLCVSIW